jgi:hypothetical protein
MPVARDTAVWANVVEATELIDADGVADCPLLKTLTG